MWNKEAIPDEWLEGIIYSNYMKGDHKLWSSYRPKMLLNVAYKIFTILMNNRLNEIVKLKIGDYQMGFRPNTYTICT
jgi:hypothetical protein